jgi:hypothetical protein
MFVGYQNDKPIYIANYAAELLYKSCVSMDRFEEVDFAIEYKGIIYTSEEEYFEAKGKDVREIRNKYLETYVDPIVSNPLRWAELSAEVQQNYTNYRKYLLDITTDESFPELDLLTFNEWVAVEEAVKESIEANEPVVEEPAEVSNNEVVEPSEAGEDIVELYSMEI